MWCGSRYGQAATPEMLDRFLQATVSALNHSPNPIIKVSGVRYVNQLQFSSNIEKSFFFGGGGDCSVIVAET